MSSSYIWEKLREPQKSQVLNLPLSPLSVQAWNLLGIGFTSVKPVLGSTHVKSDLPSMGSLCQLMFLFRKDSDTQDSGSFPRMEGALRMVPSLPAFSLLSKEYLTCSLLHHILGALPRSTSWMHKSHHFSDDYPIRAAVNHRSDIRSRTFQAFWYCGRLITHHLGPLCGPITNVLQKRKQSSEVLQFMRDRGRIQP